MAALFRDSANDTQALKPAGWRGESPTVHRTVSNPPVDLRAFVRLGASRSEREGNQQGPRESRTVGFRPETAAWVAKLAPIGRTARGLRGSVGELIHRHRMKANPSRDIRLGLFTIGDILKPLSDLKLNL